MAAMSLCVRVPDLPVVIGHTPSNEAVTNSGVPFLISDPRCTSGLRIYTQEEINALVSSASPGPGTGSTVPDAALMRESFFMSFGLVLTCYLLGKLAGAVLHVIRRG